MGALAWFGVVGIGVIAEGGTDGKALHVANAFNHHMVLQQGKKIRVWGNGKVGAAVRVSFGKVVKEENVDGEGYWEVVLPAMKGGFTARELRVSSGGEEVRFKDVLVGEVWLCGGQSNMAPGGHDMEDVEWRSADSEYVRYTRVESRVAKSIAKDLQSREAWMPLVAGKMELRRIGPVAYYFGVRLQRFLKVPVGLINTAVGGTTAEVWASRKTQERYPALKGLLNAKGKDIGAFYRGTILPLSKGAVRGVLFYQGENNTFEGYETYRHSFPSVIEDWRAAYGEKELPFGIISLAGNKGMESKPEPERAMMHRHCYMHIRDVHFATHRKVKGTGLVTIHDLGADDMHPRKKRDVGERAARWALAQVYGFGKKSPREGGVYHMAPMYRGHKVDGNKMLVYFDYDPTIKDKREHKWYKRLPLPDRAREYRGFIVAGKDGRFFPANVKVRAVKKGEDIRGECLEVWSDEVAEPAAVRYAWENQPNANAYGLHGLPVAPFRTDEWAFIRALPNWASDLEARKAANKELERKMAKWRIDRIRREAERVLERYKD